MVSEFSVLSVSCFLPLLPSLVLCHLVVENLFVAWKHMIDLSCSLLYKNPPSFLSLLFSTFVLVSRSLTRGPKHVSIVALSVTLLFLFPSFFCLRRTITKTRCLPQHEELLERSYSITIVCCFTFRLCICCVVVETCFMLNNVVDT